MPYKSIKITNPQTEQAEMKMQEWTRTHEGDKRTKKGQGKSDAWLRGHNSFIANKTIREWIEVKSKNNNR